VEALHHFALNYASLKHALTCLIDAHQLVAAAYLAQSLGLFWETQDYLLEGSELIQRILHHHAVDELPAPLKAGLYQLYSDFARHRADYALAERCYQQALAAATPEDADIYSAILRGRAEIAFRRGSYAAAKTEYEQYFALGKDLKNSPLMADALNGLGRLSAVQGHVREAYQLHSHGKTLAQQTGYSYGMGWHLNAIGEVQRLEASYDDAAASFLASAAIFQQARDYGAQALVQQNLAFTCLASGRVADAERWFKQVLVFWLRGPAHHAIALCLIGLAGVAQAQGNPARSGLMLGCADHLLREAGIQLEMPDSLMYEAVVGRASRALGREQYNELYTLGQKSAFMDLLHSTPPEHDKSQIVPVALLTPRENQVLQWVAEGITDKQIALQLGIKPHTVNVHLKAIYHKLGVHSRTAAALVFKQYSSQS
jgi:DNA-binding CsgD family transcriptional regulator/tetratricopeptide (TPR) repeat protein